MYVCVYIYMCVYIYIYISSTYIPKYTHVQALSSWEEGPFLDFVYLVVSKTTGLKL